MNETAALVRCLRKTELVYLKRYLYITSPAKNQLALKLVKLILTTQGPITEKEAAEHLYGAPPDSRMSHLKKRIRNAVFKTFLLQEPEQVFHSSYSQNYHRTMLNVINIEILWARGFDPTILRDYLHNAKVYAQELEHENFFAILSTMEYENYIQDIDRIETNHHIESTARAIENYKNIAFCKVVYHELLLKLRKKSLSAEDKLILSQRKQEVERLYQTTDCIKFKIMYFSYITYYCIYIKEFEQAEIYVAKFLDTMIANPLKSKSVSHALAYAFSVGIKQNRSKFQEALCLSEKLAESFTTKRQYDYLICLEMKVVTLINLSKVNEAVETIEEIKEHPHYLNNKLFVGHIQLYQAVLFFMQNNKKESIILLRQNNNLAEDREGWFLGLKILELMIALDDKDINSVDYHFKAIRAQLQRYPNSNAERLKLILKIAQAFIKNRNFSDAANRAENELRLLYEGKDDLYWDPRGFEVIRFERWFLSKATKFEADWLIPSDSEEEA